MGDLDRLKRLLDDVVNVIMRRVDYYTVFPAMVVSQNSDGTLELIPDSPKLSGLSKVPMRLGMPGVTVKVSKGARCLIAFENGNQKAPVATVWEQPNYVSLAFGDGTQPVARQGDLVQVYMPPIVPFVGVVGVLPATGTFTFAQPLMGTIVSGNPKVLS